MLDKGAPDGLHKYRENTACNSNHMPHLTKVIHRVSTLHFPLLCPHITVDNLQYKNNKQSSTAA